jgi:hypothetical protein
VACCGEEGAGVVGSQALGLQERRWTEGRRKEEGKRRKGKKGRKGKREKRIGNRKIGKEK